MEAILPIPPSIAATKTFSFTAQQPLNIIVSRPQKFVTTFHCKSHCLSIRSHGSSLAPITESDGNGAFLDVGMEENLTLKVNVKENGSRWSDIDMRKVSSAQRKMIEGLPPKMSGRSKALMRHIICMKEEDDPYDLILKWVKIMKPKRIDWLSILKQMNAYNHPLFLKIVWIYHGFCQSFPSNRLISKGFEPNTRVRNDIGKY